AESKGLGQGSSFTVNLPLYETQPVFTPTPRSKTNLALVGKLILVVDDSKETTEMLSKLLTLEGARVESASNGPDALRMAREHVYDLIIIDFSRPEMEGYKLVQKTRSLPAGKDLPILALTGYGRSRDIARARVEGFAGHLTKPFDLERLLRVVRGLTEG